jgi:hypothetical protein
MPHKLLAPKLAALVFAAAQLFVGVSFACKDRMYPQQFPLKELAIYEHAYVIRVEKIDWAVVPEGSWYAPPFTFQGRIERSLKGPLHRGDPVRATTSTDEAHAVCPIRLEEGKTYLLMLNGLKSPYVLPRYGSLVVASDDTLFEGYVYAIAGAASSAGARN